MRDVIKCHCRQDAIQRINYLYTEKQILFMATFNINRFCGDNNIFSFSEIFSLFVWSDKNSFIGIVIKIISY